MADAGIQVLNSGPTISWEKGADLHSRYRLWKQKCKAIFTGPLKDVDESVLCKYLLLWSGDRGFELFNSWNMSEDDQEVLDRYFEKFDQFVLGQSNVLVARQKLRTLSQGDTNLEDFLTEIRLTVRDCGFAEEFAIEQIRDTLVFGMSDQRVQFKCISKGNDLTLEDTIQWARTAECTNTQLKQMKLCTSIDQNAVHAVQSQCRKPPRKYQTSQQVQANNYQHGKRQNNQSSINKNYSMAPGSKRQNQPRYGSSSSLSCRYCGDHVHPRRQCPANNSRCNKCHKYGHFARVCLSQQSAVHKIEQNDLEMDNMFVNAVQKSKNKQEIVTENFDIYNSSKAVVQLQTTTKPYHRQPIGIDFQLDTGSEADVLPKRIYSELFPFTHKLCPPSSTLTGYGGSKIENLGSCMLYIRHKNTQYAVEFNVTPNGPAILGLNTCKKMNLIKVNYSISMEKTKPLSKNLIEQQFGDVFKGIGQFPGEPYKIKLKADSVPIVNAPRGVSIHLQDRFKAELKRMENMGVISHVSRPTEWVNSFVIVEKENKEELRICLDPRGLNKNIQREHYYTRTIDDIIPKLSNSKYFSVLDARSGYWMVQLDEESSYLTTFSTPFGRFKFNRLPFGLVVSQDIFQRKMDEVFGDLKGVSGIADDVFVFGATEMEHDINLQNLLHRARERNIRFNPDKFQLKVTETKFFGHVWTPEGLKPDPGKIDGIINMRAPQSKEDLHSFLGMVNFLNRFSPVLATISFPLRDLLKKSSVFAWHPEHEQSFQNIKKEITSLSTLTYYDPKKENVIQCDASTKGLGATLMQDSKPICYKSSSLTETEQRYSNIERELLAVVWSLEKFHHYIYGKSVLLQTDHKPLEAIFRKQISKSSPRLQRLLLRTTKYDVKVEYIPGKTNVIADALSRVDPTNCSKRGEDLPDIHLNTITSHINASSSTLDKLRQHTCEDQTLQALKQVILDKWPNERSNCKKELLPYWNYREDLSTEDNLIFKCHRLVIPTSLRPNILKLIHTGHLGIEKCILRARQSVFWPGITADVKNIISTCESCQAHQKKQSSEPLLPHRIPEYPWQKIGTDIFDLKQIHYLIFVDYFSKFPVIRRLGNTMTAESVVAHTKSVISEYGIPEVIISDNGPQYDCDLYRQLCDRYDISHKTSSPRYPQSNGQVERTIQTVKKLLLKAMENKEDPNLALLNYRSTALSSDLPSPAELLMGRSFRTLLPLSQESLKITSKNSTDNFKKSMKTRQDYMKYYFDQKASKLPHSELCIGQSVRMWNENTNVWDPATVVDIVAPRSYLIRNTKGSVYRRNRKFLRISHTNFDVPDMEDFFDDKPQNNINPNENPREDQQDKLYQNHNQHLDNMIRTRSGRAVIAPNRLNL